MPRRAHDFRGLTQPSRLRLLRAIQRRPGRHARDLAEECGLPLNTVRDHLKVLEDEGLIAGETVQRGGRGRPPVVFRPVQLAEANETAGARVADATRRGRLLRAVTGAANVAGTAGGADGAEGAHDEAGERGAATRQLDVLYEHLDDAGLEPSLDEETLTFDLAPCRYHELIDVDQPLVCAVHARLVHDVLGQTGGPLSVHRLEPFVTEHRCRLQLAARPGQPAAPTLRTTSEA